MLFSLRTGKPVEQPQANLVSDLDAMIAHPVAFRLHGKVHFIRPISVKEFYAFTNAMLSVQGLEKAEHVTPAQIIDLYYRLVASVCDSIDRSDIEKMTQAQCGALLNLIVEVVTGKAHVESEESEKKNFNLIAVAPSQLARPSKLRRLAFYLAGLLKKH